MSSQYSVIEISPASTTTTPPPPGDVVAPCPPGYEPDPSAPGYCMPIPKGSSKAESWIWMFESDTYSLSQIVANPSSFTHVCVNAYQVNSSATPTAQTWMSQSLSSIVSQIHAAGMKAIALIQGGASNSGVDTYIRNILTSTGPGNSFITSLQGLVSSVGWDGFQLDWEVGSGTNYSTYGVDLINFVNNVKNQMPQIIWSITPGAFNIHNDSDSGTTQDLFDLPSLQTSKIDSVFLQAYTNADTPSGKNCALTAPFTFVNDFTEGYLNLMCSTVTTGKYGMALGSDSTVNNVIAWNCIQDMLGNGCYRIAMWPWNNTAGPGGSYVFLNPASLQGNNANLANTWYAYLAYFLNQANSGGGTTTLSATGTGSPTSGQTPLTVTFTGSASGGAPPYSYSWQFADGTSSTALNPPPHTYTNTTPNNLTYTATFTVTDSKNNTASSNVSITVSPSASSGGPLVFGAADGGTHTSTIWSHTTAYGVTGYRAGGGNIQANIAALQSAGYSFFVAMVGIGVSDSPSSCASQAQTVINTLNTNGFTNWKNLILVPNNMDTLYGQASPNYLGTYKTASAIAAWYNGQVQGIWNYLQKPDSNGVIWGTTSGGKGVRLFAPAIAYSSPQWALLQTMWKPPSGLALKGIVDGIDIHVYPGNGGSGENITTGGLTGSGSSGYITAVRNLTGLPIIITELNITNGANVWKGTDYVSDTKAVISDIASNHPYVLAIFWFADFEGNPTTCGAGASTGTGYPFCILAGTSGSPTGCIGATYQQLANQYG